MRNHLLSIFPLQEMFDYARLSCVALDEVSGECVAPYTVSMAELMHLLAKVFSVDEVNWILGEMEAGRNVQVSITTEQSRDLGFQPKLN